MKKSFLLTTAALLAMSTAASAATLSLTGGVAGSIPESGQTNEVLENVFGFAPGDFLSGGLFGSQIEVDSDTTVTVSYWGYEASAKNSFTLNGTTPSATFNTIPFGNPGFGAQYAADALTPLATQTVDVLAGELDFEFTTNIPGSGFSAANGSNPLNTPGGFANFYSWMSAGSETVFLFFDDTGAGDDDNHDDFVVSLSVNGTPPPAPNPVPLPAGGLLLVGGLGALAVARRRKNKA